MAVRATRLFLAMAAAMMFLSSPARAEGAPQGQGSRGASQADEGRRPKRTVLHFDDDSIRGDLTRPDGELVQAPRRVAEGSLVRLRRNFVDRALASVVRAE
jgi:hypothetical protein